MHLIKTYRYIIALIGGCVMVAMTADVKAQGFWDHRVVDSPPARYLFAMVYDSCRDVIVLYGGSNFDSSGSYDDTWEWDGNIWTLRSTGGLGPRSGHSMAFDSDRCVTVLFGGNDEVGNYLNDTWEWDGNTWTQRCVNCPPPTRHGAGMAYDNISGVTLLFGGYSPGLLNDTWQWDGTTWTSVPSTAPPSPRAWPSMDYDIIRDRTVIFGGSTQATTCGARSDETWELDMSTTPATWALISTPTRPSPSEKHQMVYNEARGTMLLLGGTDTCSTVFGDVWEYNGMTWTPVTTSVTPGPNNQYALAYDSASEEIVLFGGRTSWESPVSDPNSVLDDTWTFGSCLPRGDMNGDGLINAEDIAPFVTKLLNP